MTTEQLLPVADAVARILQRAGVLAPRVVHLREAVGLVLATDVVSEVNLPGFDNSAMDGYAVSASDVAAARPGHPVALRLAGEVAAGSVFTGRVEPGTAVRIMTGAPIPAGADTVVEVEDAVVDGDIVLLGRAAETGRSFRLTGSDLRSGDLALKGGTFLGPAQVALLAAVGAASVWCFPRPRVAVVATGDELVDAGRPLGPGQVYDIVTPGMRAAVEMAGGEVLPVRRAVDTADDVRRALREAAEADVVLSVAGVSMGAHDLVRPAVEELGRIDFWRVAMRPGKPLAVGEVLGKPFVGLPGNPVSALVGFEVFVLPLLLAMSSRSGWARPRAQARLAVGIDTPVGLRTYVRAKLERTSAGWTAHPLEAQGSHQLRALALADSLLDIPADARLLEAGAMVAAILLNQPPAPTAVTV